MKDGGWVSTHEDITEREELNARLKKQYELGRQQEETLRVRNFQFDTAINNMSQGLCFFDSDHRLIVCNDRFVEMYDIAPERVSPGMSLVRVGAARTTPRTRLPTLAPKGPRSLRGERQC